ncbi:GNAT family N-acetyltransferase [Colwellia sp. RSH04]|uniref:GNAT family N-acetyltransferase n=1 Tax=Colwellia sp. RSH04 TaxID=2305464 RepID=UPI000E58CF3B|nr:GNAT family N-acetyltransferase [Colwellia sp. RSH04]RHW74689.1 N-acetyltransferase [Colwellia sp. RSH04]
MIIYTFSDDHIQQVHQLYQEVWWGKDRTLEDTKRCIRGSQVCIGILDDNAKLVGFARVLSDFIFKAIIFDVIVSESSRSQGLGQQLITLMKNHQQLREIKHFELYCFPEMETFYQQFGFSDDINGIKLMRCINTA